MKSVLIGGMLFRSKKAALDFFRAIRDSYNDGERVSDEEHHRKLMDLMAVHPEAEDKIGCGISHFTVETEQEFKKSRHFKIHRTDGSDTDVSFRSPIEGRNPRKDRLEALRRAIAPQIIEFQANAFEANPVHKCALTGEDVTTSSYHVDHEPPNTFHTLVDLWLVLEGIELLAVEITPPEDNQIVTEITNDRQKDSWQTFHQANARLRLLSPKGNLSGVRHSQ